MRQCLWKLLIKGILIVVEVRYTYLFQINLIFYNFLYVDLGIFHNWLSPWSLCLFVLFVKMFYFLLLFFLYMSKTFTHTRFSLFVMPDIYTSTAACYNEFFFASHSKNQLKLKCYAPT